MHDKKLYGTATVGSKGQVVIPADARKALNIEEGDRLYVTASSAGQFIGFIKEEQLRTLLDHLTDSIESYTNVLNQEEKE